jgi:hypothetical protein
MADGLKPAFFLLRDNLHISDSPLHELAEQTLQRIENLVREDESFDYYSIVYALKPLIDKGIISERLKDRQHASWAIAILSKRNFHPEKSWPVVLQWLEEGNPDEVFRAVWILKGCALSGFDLSEAIPGLEKALSSDSWRTRALASDAISAEYIRIGKEKELLVDESIYEKENLDSYWNVLVRHRRTYALDDVAISMLDYYAHFTPFRYCGYCGEKDAKCIYFLDDSGTSWKDRTHEYYCEKCGKYTIYHYSD